MTKSKKQKPTSVEMQILSILWEQGSLPVKDINAAMPDQKKRAYTTVLTLMQLMEKKGLVAHSNDGVRHIYRAKKTQEQILKPFMSDLLSNVFAGKPANAMQFLVGGQEVSSEEISDIRRMLDELEEK